MLNTPIGFASGCGCLFMRSFSICSAEFITKHIGAIFPKCLTTRRTDQVHDNICQPIHSGDASNPSRHFRNAFCEYDRNDMKAAIKRTLSFSESDP